MRRLIGIALALALALQPAVASASPFSISRTQALDSASSGGASETEPVDPVVAEAQAEYAAGGDAYALGNYEQAVQHFERAYELSQEPALLFNLGQAYTRWYDISNDPEHLKKARRLYENYILNIADTGLDEEAQAQGSADAQRRITEVDRRLAQHEEQAAEADNGRKRDKPVHKTAWFWVAVIGGAAVVAGGITAGVVLGNRNNEFQPELGTIGNQRGGGLTLRF